VFAVDVVASREAGVPHLQLVRIEVD